MPHNKRNRCEVAKNMDCGFLDSSHLAQIYYFSYKMTPKATQVVEMFGKYYVYGVFCYFKKI